MGRSWAVLGPSGAQSWVDSLPYWVDSLIRFLYCLLSRLLFSSLFSRRSSLFFPWESLRGLDIRNTNNKKYRHVILSDCPCSSMASCMMHILLVQDLGFFCSAPTLVSTIDFRPRVCQKKRCSAQQGKEREGPHETQTSETARIRERQNTGARKHSQKESGR